MTTKPLPRVEIESPETSRIGSLLRWAHLVLALLMIGAIVLQVFFAGATLLVDATFLMDHRALGEAMWPIPLLLIIVSLVARLRTRSVLISALVLVLYVLQYAVIHIFPSLGLPTVFRAMHAVNALLLFWVSLYLARSTWRSLRSEAQGM